MATIKIINGTRGSFPQQHATMISDQLTLKQSTGGKKTYAMQSSIASLNIGLENGSTTIFEVKLRDDCRFQAEADKSIVEHLSKFAEVITREPYVPPATPQGEPAPEGRNMVGWTITVIIAATFFYWLFKDSGAPTPPTPPSVSEKKIEAITYCKELVKSRLKAPSTADFPWSIEAEAAPGEQIFTVNSYVDAQNAFGAMLRSYYTCRLKYTGSGGSGWVVDDLTIVQ